MSKAKNVLKSKDFAVKLSFHLNSKDTTCLTNFIKQFPTGRKTNENVNIESSKSFVLDRLITNGFFDAYVTIREMNIKSNANMPAIKVELGIIISIDVIEIDETIDDYYYFIEKLNSITDSFIRVTADCKSYSSSINIDIIDSEVERIRLMPHKDMHYFPMCYKIAKVPNNLLEDNKFLYKIMSRNMDCWYMTSSYRQRFIENDIAVAQDLGRVFDITYMNGTLLYIGVLLKDEQFRLEEGYIDKDGYDLTMDEIFEYGVAVPYIEYNPYDGKLNIIDFEVILNDVYSNKDKVRGDSVDNGANREG